MLEVKRNNFVQFIKKSKKIILDDGDQTQNTLTREKKLEISIIPECLFRQ